MTPPARAPQPKPQSYPRRGAPGATGERGAAPWDAVLRLARAGRAAEALGALDDLGAELGVPLSPGGRRLRARLFADLAEAARASGQAGRALSLLDQALAEAPQAAEIHHLKARAHAERGEVRAAQSALAAALEAEPARTAAAVELALLAARSGCLGEALATLHGLGAASPPADPASFAAGMERLRAGSWEEAEGLLRRAYPADEPALDSASRRIGILLETGEAARALGEAASWSARRPASAGAHCATGLAYVALGWWDDAAEALGHALEREPLAHEARLYLAWTLFWCGEQGAAEREIGRVLAACPGHELALALRRQRREPRAQRPQA